MLSGVLTPFTESTIDQLLLKAVRAKDVDTIKTLVADGANINYEEYGLTPLMSAAANGYSYIVKLLLELGATIDFANAENSTALFFAVLNGNIDTVKLLLDSGADLHHANNFGMHVLGEAALKGHTEIVKLLLARGANVDQKPNGGLTALMIAAREGHTHTAKLLLDCGAFVNYRDQKGWTPLIYAAENGGPIEMIKLLLNRGAFVNAVDNQGWTAMASAASNGYVEIVKLLLDRGVDVNHTTAGMTTALMLACGSMSTDQDSLIKTIDTLLGAGCDALKTDSTNQTAYMMARQANNLAAMNLIQSSINFKILVQHIVKKYQQYLTPLQKTSLTEAGLQNLTNHLFKKLYKRKNVLESSFSDWEQRKKSIKSMANFLIAHHDRITAKTFDIELMLNNKLFLLGYIMGDNDSYMPQEVLHKITQDLVDINLGPQGSLLIANGYNRGLAKHHCQVIEQKNEQSVLGKRLRAEEENEVRKKGKLG